MLESLLDLLAELLGLGGGEAPPPARRARPAAPPSPASVPASSGREPQEKRARPAGIREAAAAQALPPAAVFDSALLSAGTFGDVSGSGFVAGARAGGMPPFVAALRGNPDAAKTGMVYAEIFGPPLADRGREF